MNSPVTYFLPFFFFYCWPSTQWSSVYEGRVELTNDQVTNGNDNNSIIPSDTADVGIHIFSKK